MLILINCYNPVGVAQAVVKHLSKKDDVGNSFLLKTAMLFLPFSYCTADVNPAVCYREASWCAEEGRQYVYHSVV